MVSRRTIRMQPCLFFLWEKANPPFEAAKEAGWMEQKPKYDNLHADCQHGVTITAKDRLLQAWEACMGHTRDFTKYSKLYEGTEAGEVFAAAAVKEGECAASMHDLLESWQEKKAEL